MTDDLVVGGLKKFVRKHFPMSETIILLYWSKVD